MRIARTEAHRVREAGNKDAAESVDKELQNGTTGMRMWQDVAYHEGRACAAHTPPEGGKRAGLPRWAMAQTT